MTKSKIINTCKVCGLKYKLLIDKLQKIPIWKLESCSIKCKNICSKNKLVNNLLCTTKLTI